MLLTFFRCKSEMNQGYVGSIEKIHSVQLMDTMPNAYLRMLPKNNSDATCM